MPWAGTIGGLGAVLTVQLVTVAAVLFAVRWRRLSEAMPIVISVAAGLLVATSIADLLPEAVASLGNRRALWDVLLGTITALFLLERLTGLGGVAEATPATSAAQEHGHAHGTSPLGLLLGSAAHSAVDGTGLAAAFAVDARTGWITAVAMALHEGPHRMGDFGLLLHLGVPRKRALWLSIGAGAASLVGWAAVTVLGESGRAGWLLPVSAGSFLVIALADLIPALRLERRSRVVLLQAAGFCAGIVLTLLLLRLPGAE